MKAPEIIIDKSLASNRFMILSSDGSSIGFNGYDNSISIGMHSRYLYRSEIRDDMTHGTIKIPYQIFIELYFAAIVECISKLKNISTINSIVFIRKNINNENRFMLTIMKYISENYNPVIIIDGNINKYNGIIPMKVISIKTKSTHPDEFDIIDIGLNL